MLSGVQTKAPTCSCWPSCWMINTLRWPCGQWIHCSQLCPWFSCDWRKSWSVTRDDTPPQSTCWPSTLRLAPFDASVHSCPHYTPKTESQSLCVRDEAPSIHAAAERHWGFGVACKLHFFAQAGRIQRSILWRRKGWLALVKKKNLFQIEVKYFISCFSVKCRIIIKYSA